MKLLIINGPNLNMLGIREPELYGTADYAALEKFCREICAANGFECQIVQSNHEGAIIDAIHLAYGTCSGIVINAAGYTHTSVAILDALKAVALPAVEVHLTDVQSREDFRKVSYVAMVAERTFSGKGFDSYAEAIRHFAQH